MTSLPIAELMADVMATAAELKVRKEVRETVAKVRDLADELSDAGGFSVRVIADRLRLDMNAAWRRVRSAKEAGFLTNLEDRRGQPGRFKITPEGTRLLADRQLLHSSQLPTVEDLQLAYEEDRERDRRHREDRGRRERREVEA